MIRLILFRHAKAARNASLGDKDRALEKRGRAAAERMGAWLRTENLRPDLTLVSDTRRTRETFALAAASFGESLPARLEPRVYEATAESLLRLTRTTDPKVRTLMIVGHNPGLAELATKLTGDGDRSALTRMRLKFPTGAIAALTFAESWPELGFGLAELVRFVTPGSIDSNIEDD